MIANCFCQRDARLRNPVTRDQRFSGRRIIGKHSGRHALKQRCETLGFSLTKDELDIVYTQFTALADRKKGILDEEIASLIVAAGHTARPAFAGK